MLVRSHLHNSIHEYLSQRTMILIPQVSSLQAAIMKLGSQCGLSVVDTYLSYFWSLVNPRCRSPHLGHFQEGFQSWWLTPQGLIYCYCFRSKYFNVWTVPRNNYLVCPRHYLSNCRKISPVPLSLGLGKVRCHTCMILTQGRWRNCAHWLFPLCGGTTSTQVFLVPTALYMIRDERSIYNHYFITEIIFKTLQRWVSWICQIP